MCRIVPLRNAGRSAACLLVTAIVLSTPMLVKGDVIVIPFGTTFDMGDEDRPDLIRVEGTLLSTGATLTQGGVEVMPGGVWTDVLLALVILLAYLAFFSFWQFKLF